MVEDDASADARPRITLGAVCADEDVDADGVAASAETLPLVTREGGGMASTALRAGSLALR